MFELEHVLPGVDPGDFESDPMLEAIELDDAGASGEARALLMVLVAKDLRCLDAHAHLGNFESTAARSFTPTTVVSRATRRQYS